MSLKDWDGWDRKETVEVKIPKDAAYYVLPPGNPDPELRVIMICLDVIGQLENKEVRRRVADYIFARFCQD